MCICLRDCMRTTKEGIQSQKRGRVKSLFFVAVVFWLVRLFLKTREGSFLNFPSEINTLFQYKLQHPSLPQ